MKLISITIVQMRNSADRVYIETDLPEATYPYTGHLDIEFTVARGKGAEYCVKHFSDIPIKAHVHE